MGDIGTSHKSSPILILGAALVPEENVPEMRASMDELRMKLAQNSKHLHWREHAKTWDRRQYVVTKIAELEVKLIYVIAVKDDLRAQAHAYGKNSPAALLWSLQLLTERALLESRDWPGGTREVHLYLSRIKGQRDNVLKDHFSNLRTNRGWPSWDLLHANINILNNSQLDGLQLADQICGAISAAVMPGEMSKRHEVDHFKILIPKIRRGPANEILTYGIKETRQFIEKFQWWHEI